MQMLPVKRIHNRLRPAAMGLKTNNIQQLQLYFSVRSFRLVLTSDLGNIQSFWSSIFLRYVLIIFNALRYFYREKIRTYSINF